MSQKAIQCDGFLSTSPTVLPAFPATISPSPGRSGGRTIAEDLRQFTLSMRTEVTTTVAARLHDFDKPTLVAWSADDVFFAQEDGARLAATIPNARLEVIEGARTFSMVDQPDRLADLLSTIAVRT